MPALRLTRRGPLWGWIVRSFKLKSKTANTYGSVDRSLAVPPKEAAKSGLKPSQVQISDKYGGGFPANVEGLHHLHCLVSELRVKGETVTNHGLL
jgi:hypothetical protein